MRGCRAINWRGLHPGIKVTTMGLLPPPWSRQDYNCKSCPSLECGWQHYLMQNFNSYSWEHLIGLKKLLGHNKKMGLCLYIPSFNLANTFQDLIQINIHVTDYYWFAYPEHLLGKLNIFFNLFCPKNGKHWLFMDRQLHKRMDNCTTGSRKKGPIK